MGISVKWVRLILLWTSVVGLGLCADNTTLVDESDDSVVVEARSLPETNSRGGRQLKQVDPVNWYQAFSEGSACLTSKGEIGSCIRFRACYPSVRDLGKLLRQQWESPSSWLLQGQESCNFFDERGQQTVGICCLNMTPSPPDTDKEDSNETSNETPTGTAASYEDEFAPPNLVDNNVNDDPNAGSQEYSESGEQYLFNWPPHGSFATAGGAPWPPPLPTHAPGVFGQWPPPIPTHPPNHHYPTHPPHPGLPTHPPTTPSTTARPIYPTYRPTQRPPYPTYPTTSKPVNKPTTSPPDYVSATARCGAKNGVSPDQERIVGGQNSSPHEWPWIVVLFNKGKQFCGGSLIDNMHVLTAAHCVARMTSWDVAGLTAHLGDHNIRTTFEVMHVERKIKRLVRHKGFDFSTLHNDVAVLTLDRPVMFTKEIRPICLPHASVHKSYSGQVATVAGWGSLRENGPQPSILQKVNIPIWSNIECARKYGRAAPGGIIESMLCAGQAARDSCSGDSGGPLMISEGGNWMQIGIVSWGIGCGKGQYPGVYTRVTAFLPWIMKNLK